MSNCSCSKNIDNVNSKFLKSALLEELCSECFLIEVDKAYNKFQLDWNIVINPLLAGQLGIKMNT